MPKNYTDCANQILEPLKLPKTPISRKHIQELDTFKKEEVTTDLPLPAQLKVQILNHNKLIVIDYFKTVLKEMPFKNIKEIEDYANNGYLLIGYKGTSRKKAVSFIEKIDSERKESATTGSARGSGLYVATRYIPIIPQNANFRRPSCGESDMI